MNNFITFCAVYRNEAQRMRYGLDIASKLFDNMLLCVQKSDDATLKIAKEYTKNIIERPPEPPEVSKDFIMQNLKTRWMFYLDADEVPSLSLIRFLERITPSEIFNRDSISFIRVNYINGVIIEGGQGIDRQFRMLRDYIRWDCLKQGRFAHIHPLVRQPEVSNLVIYHHRTLEKVKDQTEVWNKYEPKTKEACDKYVVDVEKELGDKTK